MAAQATKTIDKLPDVKKAPPKPTARPVAQAPAVTAATTPAVAPSNGVAAHNTAGSGAAHAADKPAPSKPERPPKAGSIPRPTDVIDLQGAPQFVPGGWADYIKSFGGKPAEVDVKWGQLAPRTTIALQWDSGAKVYSTTHYQPLPIVQPFFAGLPDKLAPALFVKIHKDAITGFAAPHATENAVGLAAALSDPKITAALGLAGFKLPSPRFDNQIKDGHFVFGTDELSFTIAGWLSGKLKLSLIDDNVEFSASSHLALRGLAAVDLTVTRSKDGHYTGKLEIPVTLGKASGHVLACYDNGDVSITGTIGYTSEKFNGSLTVMFGEVNEVQAAARGQLDPGKLLATESVDASEKAEKAKKGERGVGAWGQLDFAFTDWLTGSALTILDPFGHITVVGKIAVKDVVLMKAPDPVKKSIPPFPIGVAARYGLPHVADVHIGFDLDLGFTAWVGPAMLTGIEIGGTYSTDPAILQDFYITGAFRISAYAGLYLAVSVKAGVTILGHDLDAVGTITGSAGVKAYAEAAAKIGYREKADPVAGKKGEAYLQGHLEAAAQPVLGLGGEVALKLSTPWWSPLSDRTWSFPLFSYEWPLDTSLGVGADIDYIIGSNKLPDIKLGAVDFDSSKFSDAVIHDDVPAKKGSAENEKRGSWKGVEPKIPTAPASEAPKGPAPARGKPARAGTPSTKPGKGKQTPEEAANVPKTPEVAKRWLEGLQELATIHQQAEKSPEDDHEIHAQLAHLKNTYGFTEARATPQGDEWQIDIAMNPRTRKQVRRLVSEAGKRLPPPKVGEEGNAYAARIGYPLPETNYHWAIIPPNLVYKRNPGKEASVPEMILNTGKRPPNFIEWAKPEPGETEKKAAFGEEKMHEHMEKQNNFDLISERGKSPFATGIDGVYQNRTSGGRPKYVIGEAKFGTARLKPGQLTVQWVDDRLDAVVGRTKADEIRATKYQRWVVYVDAAGRTHHEVLI